MRKVTEQTVSEYLTLASDLMESHPDRFVGFDLVGQEDMGEPLVNFAEEIIAAKERDPNLRFFFHAGETDWQGSSTDINVIDALLVRKDLGKRIFKNLKLLQFQSSELRGSDMGTPSQSIPRPSA